MDTLLNSGYIKSGNLSSSFEKHLPRSGEYQIIELSLRCTNENNYYLRLVKHEIGKIYKGNTGGGRSPQLLKVVQRSRFILFVRFVTRVRSKNSNMHVKSIFLLITILTFVALKPVKSVSPFVFFREIAFNFASIHVKIFIIR